MSNTPTKHRTLAEIEADLRTAQEVYTEAKKAASEAARRKADAESYLCKLQKELNAAVNALKFNAPCPTTWHAEHRVSQRVIHGKGEGVS